MVYTAIALVGHNTDMKEARSLTFGNWTVDIYSNSWGPADNGSNVEGPGMLTNLALQTGARKVWKSMVHYMNVCGLC